MCDEYGKNYITDDYCPINLSTVVKCIGPHQGEALQVTV